jgi:hypothetical protein
LLCGALGLSWQLLTVHFNYGGNLTALFCSVLEDLWLRNRRHICGAPTALSAAGQCEAQA